MDLEVTATTERTAKVSRQAFARADLIIYDDRYIGAGGELDVAFIMLEAMEPGKKFEGDEDLGWNYHYKQLNIYMAASASARNLTQHGVDLTSQFNQFIKGGKDEFRTLP